jgi:ribosomal protein S18 acetylase RimI-like enzyme
MHIRRAVPTDAPKIACYNQAMASETEGKHLPDEIVNAGVRAVFDDPKKGFYLVAEANGDVVGQLMVTLEWSDWRDGWFWWVQSVYVEPGQREKGIFRKLFETILREAEEAGDVVGVRLYVEHENRRAQEVYQRLSMSDTGYLVFERMIEAKKSTAS